MSKAICIGGGPSIEKFKHLELLAKSNFKGHLFISDIMMKPCLEAGITPDKFPDFHVVSVEFGTYIRNFYTRDMTNELTQKYASKIHCILYAYENDFTNILRRLGFNVEVIADNQFSRTFANVGITGWFLAHDKYQCDDIALIGMNMSWDKSYIDSFPKEFEIFWSKKYNEEINSEYWLDPLYTYYSEVFLDWLAKYPNKTTNCTEEGSLHGPGVKNRRFKDWLAMKI